MKNIAIFIMGPICAVSSVLAGDIKLKKEVAIRPDIVAGGY
jgi:hypothetical protein